MSGYAYKCDGCGGGFVDGPGPVMCCGGMRQPYACGCPPRDFSRPPMIISDEIHGGGFDWAAGRKFTSKSERDAYYRANQLQRISVREARDRGIMSDHPSPTKTYSFKGQTNRDTTRRWTDRVQ